VLYVVLEMKRNLKELKQNSFVGEEFGTVYRQLLFCIYLIE
jgi:hypothetical protein